MFPGRGPGAALVAASTFEGDDLRFVGQRAVLTGLGPAGVPASDGPGRAVVASAGGLAAVDLRTDDPLAQMQWQTAGAAWRHTGIGESQVAAPLHGAFQNAWVDASGRFVAGMRSIDVRTLLDDSPNLSEVVTRHGGLAVGALGEASHLAWRTELFTTGPAVDRYVGDPFTNVAWPVGEGRVLVVEHARGDASAPRLPETVIGLRLAIPAAPPARDLLPAAGAIGRLPACGPGAEPDDCLVWDLGWTTEATEVEGEVPWFECEKRETWCTRDALREQFEAAWNDFAVQAVVGDWFLDRVARCVPGSVVVTETDERLRLQCRRLDELYRTRPGLTVARGAAVLTPVPAACDDMGAPRPLRLVDLVPEGIDVDVRGPDGAPATTAKSGDTLTLTAQGEGSFEWEVIQGDAEIEGEGASVRLRVSGAGVVVVRVIRRDAAGRVVAIEEVVVAVEGPGLCDADDESVRTCAVAAPWSLDEVTAAQDALPGEATDGEGVALHDLSFSATLIDLSVDGVAGPFRIGRTHRTAHLPDDGGPLGGWTASFDQRIVAAGDATCRTEGEGVDRLYFDDRGRGVRYRFPAGGARAMRFGPGGDEVYLTYDHAAQAARTPAFRARVVEYERPVGRVARLRAYTLLEGEEHPWYVPENTAIPPSERRFYELAWPGGERAIFNCRGQLVRLVDPQLREVELVYDGPVDARIGARLPGGLIDANGRRWTFDWRRFDRRWRLARVRDPFGRRVEYGYTAHPKLRAALTSVTQRFDDVVRTWRYRYDADGRLTHAFDPDGRESLRLTYDDGGRVLTQARGGGARQAPGPSEGATWDFAVAGDVVTVTGPTGDPRDYRLGALGAARVVASVEEIGEVWDGETDPPGVRTVPLRTTYAHHPETGLPASITYPSGRVVTFEHDALGNPKRREARGADGAVRIWTFTHGEMPCATMLTSTEPDGATTTYVPYPDDPSKPGLRCQVQRRERPAPLPGRDAVVDTYAHVATGPLRGLLESHTVGGRAATWTYDPGQPEGEATPSGKRANAHLGQLTALTQSGEVPEACVAPSEISQSFRHDARGNLVETTRGDLVERRRYDGADRLVERVVGETVTTRTTWDALDREMRSEVSGPGMATVVDEYVYDRLGRRVGTSSAAPGLPGMRVERVAYDGEGRIVARVRPGPGATPEDEAALRAGETPPGRFDPARGPSLVTETTRRDRQGRVVEIAIGGGGEGAFRGRIVRRFWRDAAGNAVLYDAGRDDREGPVLQRRAYDGLDRLLSVEHLDPACEQPLQVVAHVSPDDGPVFDGRDHPRAIEIRGGDGMADLSAPLFACGPPVPLLRITQQFDAWGRRILARHTALRRPAGLTDAWTPPPDREQSWIYDDEDRVVLARLAAGSLRVATQRAHTPFGEVCREITDTSGVGVDVQTTFDARGRPEEIVETHTGADPVTVKQRFGFDALGRATERRDGVGRVWRTEHDALGRVVSTTAPGGRRLEVTYDGAGRVAEERQTDPETGETRTTRRTWGGERVVREERLVGEARLGARDFAWDAGGAAVRTWPYGSEFAALFDERTYDAEGRLLAERTADGATRDYLRDALGRAIEITGALDGEAAGPGYTRAPAPTLTFRYDGLGELTHARGDGIDVVRVLGGFGEVLEETTTDGAEALTVRARYDGLGQLAALYYPGAPPDAPDLELTHDAAGRLRSVVAGARLFGGLEAIGYGWSGDLLRARETRLRSGRTLRAEWAYDEAGARHGVTHLEGGARVHESRKWWFGEHVAAQASVPWIDGAPQSEIVADLDAERAPAPAGGVLSSQLRAWPAPFEQRDVEYASFDGLPRAASVSLYRRNAFGEVLRSQTLARPRGGGRGTVSTTWRTLDRARVRHEQTLSWTTSVGDPFADGEPSLLHDVYYCYADDAGGPCEAAAERIPERLSGTVHGLAVEPDPDAFGAYPLPSAGLPSERSYRVGFSRGGLLATHRDDVSARANEHRYDVFDRLVELRDFNEDLLAIEPADPQSQQPPPPRALTMRLRYDALDRHVGDGYDPLPSAIPGEAPRRVAHLGARRLYEVEGERVSAYVPGAGDLPYMRLPFGEAAVLEDVDGGFAGLVLDGEPAATTTVTSQQTARKPVPVVEAGVPGLFDGLLGTARQRLGIVPEEVLRLVSPGVETVPFMPGLTLSPEGPSFDFARHPHEHIELQRLRRIGAMVQLLVDAVLNVATVLAPELLPFRWALAVDGVATAYDAVQLVREVQRGGLSAGALLQGAFLVGPVWGAARAQWHRTHPPPRDPDFVADVHAYYSAAYRHGALAGEAHAAKLLDGLAHRVAPDTRAFLASRGLTDREILALIEANDALGGGLTVGVRSFGDKAQWRRRWVQEGVQGKPGWVKAKTSAESLGVWVKPQSGIRQPITSDIDLAWVLKHGAPMEPQAARFRGEWTRAYKDLPGPANGAMLHGPHLDLRHLKDNGKPVFGAEVTDKFLEKLGPPREVFEVRFDAQGRLSAADLSKPQTLRYLDQMKPPTGWPQSWRDYYAE